MWQVKPVVRQVRRNLMDDEVQGEAEYEKKEPPKRPHVLELNISSTDVMDTTQK